MRSHPVPARVARHTVVIALLALGAGGAQAQFKCIDAKGATSFQQTPCPQGQKETPLDMRHDPAPPAAPRPAAGTRPAGQAAAAAPVRTGLAPSGRPCRTAAEYAEIQRQLAALPKKPASSQEPGMATAQALFGGLDQKLAEEMKACL